MLVVGTLKVVGAGDACLLLLLPRPGVYRLEMLYCSVYWEMKSLWARGTRVSQVKVTLATFTVGGAGIPIELMIKTFIIIKFMSIAIYSNYYSYYNQLVMVTIYKLQMQKLSLIHTCNMQ